MRGFFHRLAAAYGSAIILMFFSEYFFVNEEPVLGLLNNVKNTPFLTISSFASFASFYVLFTYPFLLLLSYFKVRTISSLLLAGAIFGWSTEGLFIPILYESIPISFVFPSISWHALIDVLLGWYLVRMVMRNFGMFGNAISFVALGVVWAMWATWFWGGTDANDMSRILPDDFMLLAVVSSSFWLLGLLLADWFTDMKFQVSKWEVWIIGVIYILFFLYTAFPYLPYSALIIPIIMLTIFSIYLGRNHKQGVKILERLAKKKPDWRVYFLLPLTPIVATIIYPWFYTNNISVPTEDVVAVLLFVGFVWFIFALIVPFISYIKR